MKLLNLVKDSVKRPQYTDQKSWSAYLKSYDTKFEVTPCEIVLFYPNNVKIPTSSGIDHIDSYVRNTDGIWHPDKLTPIMGWKGGNCELNNYLSGSYFDPFIVSSQMDLARTHYFTESLPKSSAPLFWSLLQPGSTTHETRSNEGIALLDTRPSWLTKSAFLAFTSLRAYPHLQLKELCGALKERSLPLDCPEVLILFRQALYHLGDIEPDASVHTDNVTDTSQAESRYKLSWRVDREERYRILEEELKEYVDELKESPRDSKKLHLLGEVASFLTQWRPSCRDLTRKISDITLRWARESETALAPLANTIDPHYADLERAKQYKYYAYSLLSHRTGDLTSADIDRIILLMALAQNVRLFGDNTGDEEVSALEVVVRSMMTALEARLSSSHNWDGSLNVACRAVLGDAAFQRVAKFNRLPGVSLCFDADIKIDDHTDLVSINVISGVVLYNGLPLKRLPVTVTLHPMYVRTFGKRIFETLPRRDKLVTVTPMLGCHYEFIPCLDFGNPISIKEIYVSENKQESYELELLDGVTNGGWKGSLPQRLHTMYSHWYCKKLKSIFLRPIHFLDRDVHFILRPCDVEDVEDIKNAIFYPCTCFTVPQNRRGHHILDLYEELPNNPKDFDRLVLYDPPLKGIFGKFENPLFIHTLITSQDTFVFCLPRFGLKFETRSDGKVHSLDFVGCHLAECQQLSDTLMNFHKYLLLESDRGEMKVVIPTGVVLIDAVSGTVTTKSSNRSDASRMFYVYSIHSRLATLKGSNLAAQLHLAALYVATSSALPDGRTGMTGDETAISIVRQEWVNRPLTKEESIHLANITRLNNRSSALAILSNYLQQSSQQFSFLYKQKNPIVPIAFDCLAPTQYEKSSVAFAYRCSLTSGEEKEIFGGKMLRKVTRLKADHGVMSQQYLMYTSEEAYNDVIRTTEEEVKSIVTESDVKCEVIPFPLKEGTSKIGEKMINDLKGSWDAHHNLKVKSVLPQNRESSLIACVAHLERITNMRQPIEAKLLKKIGTLPIGERWDKTSARLHQICYVLPRITLVDLMRIAFAPEHICHFNPFFSKDAQRHIIADILIWLQLCVLEDRLGRIVYLGRTCTGGMCDEKVVSELDVRREWSVEMHPEWLVFEVEGSLQIRPVQYQVVQSLIDNEGAITQLNMGEGKTRVMLPMLVLHWGSRARQVDAVVRLHFLSQLLQEAFDFLHRNLSSSVLGYKIIQMPFNRDVKLTPEMVRIMLYRVRLNLESGGFLLVAREHRLSLKLKWDELHRLDTEESNETCSGLDELNDIKHIDILDESEELLSHKIELNYAIGGHQQLPGGPSRWKAAQGVLRTLKSDPTVQLILSLRNVSVRDTPSHGDTSESFPKYRLICGEALDVEEQSLIGAISRGVLQAPPYELRWLSSVSGKEKEDVIEFITNPKAVDETFRASATFMKRSDDLLALRGLLAFRNLTHCLQKRHRVDYGVNRINGKKRIAIPFRASDVPCDRSEFAHPDIGIIFTLLSYYSDGLSEKQFRETLVAHFELGASEQEKVYGEWFELSRGSMNEEDREKIDDVRKVDPSNAALFDLLYTSYRYNIATIGCWLERVFQLECMQYPEKLSACAWDLVNNPQVQCRGFSGTNDKKLLLPLQVHSHQVEKDDEPRVLGGTNGKMLDLLLKCSIYVNLDTQVSMDGSNASASASSVAVTAQMSVKQPTWQRAVDYALSAVGAYGNNASASASSVAVATEQSVRQPSWQLAVDYALRTRCAAIFDAGALLVGASNREVADYALRQGEMCLQGDRFENVLYFDMSEGENRWMIRNIEGRMWPMGSSPVKECECLIVFDESRCIGTDMKMHQNAKCVLTIGAGMCKDKLMQAAGRARKLGKGQTLVLLGLNDITEKICPGGEPPQPSDVLDWIMSNTTASTEQGLQAWGEQGGRFCATAGRDSAQFVIQDEVLALEDLYCHVEQPGSLFDTHQRKVTQMLNRREGLALSDAMGELSARVSSHVEDYGADITVLMTKKDGECERELEQEVLLEKEVERQIPRSSPCAEVDWSYKIVTAKEFSFEAIHNASAARTLSDLIEGNVDPRYSLESIPWSSSISCTKNFANTVSPSGQCIQDYLRQAKFFLYFPKLRGSHVILLSEREANGIISYLQKMTDGVKDARSVHHLPYAKQRTFKGQAPGTIYATLISSLQLFNGETTYKGTYKEALCKLLALDESRKAALLIPDMRGQRLLVSRSDLEDVCTAPPRI